MMIKKVFLTFPERVVSWRVVVFAWVDVRIEGSDLPMLSFDKDFEDNKRGTFDWGPFSSDFVERWCLRDTLVVPGLKNLKTDDNGRHWGGWGWLSCTASAAGSVKNNYVIAYSNI